MLIYQEHKRTTHRNVAARAKCTHRLKSNYHIYHTTINVNYCL